MTRWISIVMLLVVIAVTGALLFRVMANFLLPLFLAAVLTVIFRPVHRWMMNRCRQRERLAALLTTLLVLVAVLAPACVVAVLAVREGLGALGGGVLDRAQHRLEQFRHEMELEIPWTLPDPTGGEMIRLELLDEELRELPDQLPDEDHPMDAATRQRFQFVSAGVANLLEQLESTRQAAAAPAMSGEDLRVKRVRGLLELRPDKPFEPLEQVLQTLRQVEQYTAELQTAQAGPVAVAAAGRKGPSDTGELRRSYGRIKTLYEGFRIDLLGGAVRGWLTDLVNPDVHELDSVRANLQRYLRSWLPSVAGQATAVAGHLMLGLGIMTLSLFYFLKDGPVMVQTLMRLSPMDDNYERELLEEFETVSRAVVLATLLSAAAQAALGAIAYFFAGFESIFLLTSLTFLLALVPFVGAAAVWMPACLWLAFVEQRFVAAGVLLVFGGVVISMVDNIVKPMVLHGQSNLHPLLALLSVLGGVQALGPIGILVGPMVVSFLQALLNILRSELNAIDEGKRGERIGTVG